MILQYSKIAKANRHDQIQTVSFRSRTKVGPGTEATARNVSKYDATDTNGLVMYDRYMVYDKSVFIDFLKKNIGLETEEVNAAMVDRRHEQK